MADDEEPTPEQLDAVERERMNRALKPFTRPGLRKAIIDVLQTLYQIIDEAAIDVLLDFGHSEAAVASARSKLDDFQRFIEENKDEIEALRILYGRPYRAGLRYRHVKELRDALRNPPVGIHDPANGLWRLYEALEPERVKGRGGSALVDLVAIVKHAIEPDRAARAGGGAGGGALPGMARGEGACRADLHARPTQVAGRDQGSHRKQSADRAGGLRGRAVQPVGRAGGRVPGVR